MEELLKKVLEEGEWKSLRFTVYNQLEEHEFYQKNLEKMGYDWAYEDLECKVFECENCLANSFKRFVEDKIQDCNVVVAICVLDGRNYFTVVKPISVNILSVLKLD